MSYEVGNEVLLDTKNLNLAGSKKFKTRWVGPFRVVATAGPVACKLELGGRLQRVHPVFHISLLKPYHAGGDGRGAPESIEAEGDKEFEIERLL